MAPSPETSSAGFSSFSLRVFSKWDRSRLVGSLASSTSSGGESKESCYCWRGKPTQELSHKRLPGREREHGERTHPEPAGAPCPRQPLSPLACHVLSLEAARAVAAGESVMGNCLAPRRGWLLVGNAKDVPGRGSRGWDAVRAHVAAAARRGPGASPGSCGSAGLGPGGRLCAAASLCLPTPPKNYTASWRRGC